MKLLIGDDRVDEWSCETDREVHEGRLSGTIRSDECDDVVLRDRRLAIMQFLVWP
jgi:hypothetical protein